MDVAPTSFGTRILRWFDNESTASDPTSADWVRKVPFVVLHLSCLMVLWVGWSPFAVALCVGLYLVRMFAITAFYHRYFSHRAFKTSRVVQFLGALLGVSSIQRGPLWWAAHHRAHHRHADQPTDRHSPSQTGFWHSHMGWIFEGKNYRTQKQLVKDWLRYPELRFIDRFDLVVPFLALPALYILGAILERSLPSLGTSGGQLVVWGFSISTVVLYHMTFTINSLAHRFGSRRFDTPDDSRNNALLALVTLGEGWHNNHHYYQASARQGFRWWEIDPTFYVLKVLSWVGLVWDLKPLPERVRLKAQESRR